MTCAATCEQETCYWDKYPFTSKNLLKTSAHYSYLFPWLYNNFKHSLSFTYQPKTTPVFCITGRQCNDDLQVTQYIFVYYYNYYLYSLRVDFYTSCNNVLKKLVWVQFVFIDRWGRGGVFYSCQNSKLYLIYVYRSSGRVC